MGAGASSGRRIGASEHALEERAAAAHLQRGASIYAVAKGREPGLYLTWTECMGQTSAYQGALFQSFSGADGLSLAKAFVEENVPPSSDGRPRRWSANRFVEMDERRLREEADDALASTSLLVQEEEDAPPVPRATVETCCRYGISIEGLEHFLEVHGSEIPDSATVTDVCHTVIMPRLCPPGWDDVVTLEPASVSDRGDRYAHRYVPRAEAPAHAGARRLRGREHTHRSGHGRAAFAASRLTGGQARPPPGTRSWCARLAAAQAEALAPLRDVLLDVPRMTEKELRSTLAELPRVKGETHGRAEHS